jgi:uncharacterized protein involved in type VI secretion and phage assembly
MPYRLLGDTEEESETAERPVYGTAVARVESNRDRCGQGRVKVSYPWAPGITPWARVAVPMAGKGRGTYFMPQEGDEVLVSFQNGDIRDPFVIGSLWNGKDTPPAEEPADAANKWLIRTPKGHDLVLDDQAGVVTITAKSKGKTHTIKIGPSKIEVAAADGKATLTLEDSGKVSVQASASLELKAETITIEGKNLSLKGTASATLDGGQACTVKATQVLIN